MAAIVLPRGAVNSESGIHARHKLGERGAVRAVITLPPETFGATGTMTNTVVLFLQKFGEVLSPNDEITPVVARISNVGFDTTGRVREGSQLPGLGQSLRLACDQGRADVRITKGDTQKAKETIPSLPDLVKGVSRSTTQRHARCLRDYVLTATTGATPPRKAYTDAGLFLVKVGNLTGSGINWIPRDRNFIAPDMIGKRYSKETRVLQVGDIVLTSSAHSPKYIAKKIDIVDQIPEWVGGAASFVGEVMLLRPNQNVIDPYILVSYLRLPTVVDEIQNMIRGQTAHLHPDDILSLRIDESILENEIEIREMARLIEEEAVLSAQLNEVMWKQMQLADGLLKQVGVTQMVS